MKFYGNAEWSVNFKIMTRFCWHLRVMVHWSFSQYVCIGKPYVCNVFRPRGTWVGVATRTYEPDDLYLIYSKLQYRVQLCSAAHRKASFSVCNTAKLGVGSGDLGCTMSLVIFGQFIFCLVYWSLKKKMKELLWSLTTSDISENM